MIIKKIRKAKPKVLTALKIFAGIFLLEIASTKRSKSLPPSRAGRGKRLMSERLMEIRAVRISKELKPNLAASPTIPTIPTGPATFSIEKSKMALIVS